MLNRRSFLSQVSLLGVLPFLGLGESLKTLRPVVKKVMPTVFDDPTLQATIFGLSYRMSWEAIENDKFGVVEATNRELLEAGLRSLEAQQLRMFKK